MMQPTLVSTIVNLFLILLFSSNLYAQNESYINKAGENFIEGDVEKAISILEFVLKKDSTNERAYFNLGNFNTAAGNFEAAINNYLKAAELYPKHVESSSTIVGLYPKYYEAIDNLALVYLVTSNFPEAIKLTEESSMPGYDVGQPLRTSYLAHILIKDYNKGTKRFEKYKSLTQDFDEIKSDSILIALFKNNKLSENGFISYLKASITNCNPEKALEYLKPALLELPNNTIFLELKKQYSDPDYLDNRADELEKNNEYLRAKYLLQIENNKEAEEILDELLEDDPDNLSYMELLAMAKFSMNKTEESISICNRMIDLNPGAAVTWYNMGNYYFRMKSLDKAEECFLKSLEIAPEYPESNSFLGSIVWIREQDYVKAKKYYEREIEINPKNEDTYFNFAKMCFQNENYEDAIKYLSQLISLNPYDVEARARLIDMYVTIDDKENALKFANESLKFVLDNKQDEEVIKYFRNKRNELEPK